MLTWQFHKAGEVRWTQVAPMRAFTTLSHIGNTIFPHHQESKTETKTNHNKTPLYKHTSAYLLVRKQELEETTITTIQWLQPVASCTTTPSPPQPELLLLLLRRRATFPTSNPPSSSARLRSSPPLKIKLLQSPGDWL